MAECAVVEDDGVKQKGGKAEKPSKTRASKGTVNVGGSQLSQDGVIEKQSSSNTNRGSKSGQ